MSDQPEEKRPEYVTDKHLEYLDNLRLSGICNMFESPSFVKSRFSISVSEAIAIVMYWMKTFGKEDR